MKISHWQKLSGLFFQPPGFSQGLALGAVAVAAGVVSWALKAARIAAIQVPTEILGPADRHGPDNFLLTGRHTMRSSIALPVLAKNLGQLGARSFLSYRQLGAGRQHSGIRLKRGAA